MAICVIGKMSTTSTDQLLLIAVHESLLAREKRIRLLDELIEDDLYGEIAPPQFNRDSL